MEDYFLVEQNFDKGYYNLLVQKGKKAEEKYGRSSAGDCSDDFKKKQSET